MNGGTAGAGPRAAAFFDLDKTVIATSSSMALSRPFLRSGLLTRRTLLRSVYAQLRYLLVGADHASSERMKLRLAAASTGWEVLHLDTVVDEALQAFIAPVVYLEALDLISAHQAAGHDVVVVSASAEDIVRPIAQMLGADHVVATRMAVADGRYTGGIDYYAYGPAKAAAVHRMAREHGYATEASYAYSDSHTDLPMLEAVGHPVAVNPDRALRRAAVGRGWQVRDFRRPVRLHPGVPRVALVGVGAVLGAAGVTALARHRSRR
ncbi:HAD-IB family hydrolase [Georgenia sp. 10Sc9-8]|uniref:HAD-IB family hydrolase n=1 Tax=Georgenia halotolerans TaxID=3028317 RepID=A0ABT5U171_9MICO|nr:HAD-IB family hydrolase [Georgenia halotolerans]